MGTLVKASMAPENMMCAVILHHGVTKILDADSQIPLLRQIPQQFRNQLKNQERQHLLELLLLNLLTLHPAKILQHGVRELAIHASYQDVLKVDLSMMDQIAAALPPGQPAARLSLFPLLVLQKS